MAELDFEVTDEVDITDKVCPLTFVKAKVAIEELEDGEILAVRMNDGEPVQNVPRSMKEEGHKVPVVLWEIEPTDERNLDRYEGFPIFYYKEWNYLSR